MAKIVINPAGVRELLNSDGVAADLMARAERVKAAADSAGIQVQWPGEPRIPLPYSTQIHHGPTRVVARVAAAHPGGLRAEAKYHMLTAALDAAR